MTIQQPRKYILSYYASLNFQLETSSNFLSFESCQFVCLVFCLTQRCACAIIKFSLFHNHFRFFHCVHDVISQEFGTSQPSEFCKIPSPKNYRKGVSRIVVFKFLCGKCVMRPLALAPPQYFMKCPPLIFTVTINLNKYSQQLCLSCLSLLLIITQ